MSKVALLLRILVANFLLRANDLTSLKESSRILVLINLSKFPRVIAIVLFTFFLNWKTENTANFILRMLRCWN